ncbi:MAG TPA: cyclic nucleotide-binding domain-containing protein [Kouleothrix sp.]|uniref:cyclic nucleotide-binding domain-containing protein n=1 Tax=Kouleothrix sp. TaxID=2779161 RepID=UPI002BBCF0D4|nr:cyclic nucleotide-binding domain-containing protein [Kouleothrix sp.]HRC75208.1 cyclic nucleotide-binding domain-containing protein [Kouleothrix sp.]
MSYASMLARVEIFDELGQERLERISQICIEHRLREGDVVFEQNARSDGLYIILGGAIDIQVQAPGAAAPATVARLKPGQSFGEVALVDEGIRTATARVGSAEARLLALRRADLMELCREDFELGFVLMRNLAADLALKIRQTDLRVRS